VYVVRAVLVDVDKETEAEARSSGRGLDAWLSGSGGSVSVKLTILRIRRVGFLVQRLPEEGVSTVWEPSFAIESVGDLICRFHEGPWGRPEEHRYCTRRAVTRDGYCEVHRRSWRALYEKCAQGMDSACVSVAPLLRGYEFSVYVLDYGGSRVKAGLTQGWRRLWRIAEQPHVAAAIVYSGDLLSAREMEKKLGSLPLGTEGAAARFNKRIESSIVALKRLIETPNKIAERLASLLERLGLKGSFEAYTILPRSGVPGWLVTTRRGDLGDLLGKRVRVLDYWAGYLLLDIGGSKLVVHKSEIQHRDLNGLIVSATTE
jgi:hypothetical protein